MKLLPLAGALVALALFSGCSQLPVKTNHVAPISAEYEVTALAAQAKGEAIVIATMSTFGSFEWGTSPLVTLADASIKHGPQLLHDSQISVDEAQRMINAAVVARDLLKKANATCNQNRAGKCTGNQVQAETFSDQAKAEIVRGCLALTDQEILACLHR